MPIRPLMPTLLAMALTLACGGGGSSQSTPSGTLTLRLGSDSLPGYSQAVVSLEKVEASSNGTTWAPLGNVKATFDLMALQNGHGEVILPAAAIAAGTYAQFRLTWATVNYQSAINQPAYVVPTGGAGHLMAMPVTTVVSGPVTVPASGSVTAQIMLSSQQAVQSRADGTTTFQATGRAYELGASARIAGRLSAGTTPLAGVEVLAETVDGGGLAALQRRALSDASGNYALEGLPTGSLYFVVSQPAGSGSAYAAVAAAPVNATSASTYTADLGFGAVQTPGSLSITLTPASTSSQGTWTELRQTLSTGGSGSQTLIVRTQTMATTPSQDQALISGLAPGTYGVSAQRSTSGAAPVRKVGTQVLVEAGATAATSLAYP